MSNAWINHVKNYSLQNNVSYKEALTLAKPTYRKLRGYGLSGSKNSKKIQPIGDAIDNALDRDWERYVETLENPRNKLSNKLYHMNTFNDWETAVRRENEKLYKNMTTEEKRQYNIAQREQARHRKY